MSASQRWLPFYLILALIWGCSFLFIEVGLKSFTPAGVAFTRIAFGALVLIIVSLVTRTPILPRWSWKYVFVASMLWASIPWTLFSFAQQYVTSAFAGIINGTTPLMTLVAIMIAFREEKPTRQRIVGLLIGFVGMVIVVGVWNPVQSGESSSLLGELSRISSAGGERLHSSILQLSAGSKSLGAGLQLGFNSVHAILHLALVDILGELYQSRISPAGAALSSGGLILALHQTLGGLLHKLVSEGGALVYQSGVGSGEVISVTGVIDQLLTVSQVLGELGESHSSITGAAAPTCES